jgi:hypothetical protein
MMSNLEGWQAGVFCVLAAIAIAVLICGLVSLGRGAFQAELLDSGYNIERVWASDGSTSWRVVEAK